MKHHQCIDIIAVTQKDGSLKVSPFFVIFPNSKQKREVEIKVNGSKLSFKMVIDENCRYPYFNDLNCPKKVDKRFLDWFTQIKKKLREKVDESTFAHTNLIPTEKEIEEINTILQIDKKEENKIEFTCGELTCKSKIFAYNYDQRLVVADIDGTVTKSDLRGHIFTQLEKDYTHAGTAELFTSIVKKNYKFVYLTARPITMYTITRRYLEAINQNETQLPKGAIITSPNKSVDSFIREVIIKEPHMFKISILSSIQALFPSNPIVAGFGNRNTDAEAYSAIGIPDSHIFIINKSSCVHVKGISKYNTYKDMIKDMDILF